MIKKILSCFIISFFFLSCSMLYRVDFDETSFEKEYELWKENNFTDYIFVYDRHIYEGGKMFGKVKISVSNGNGIYEVLSETMTIDPEEIKSIDDIFEYIKSSRKELDRIAKKEKKASYVFSISYDEVYHYPKYIQINENIRKRLNLSMPYSEKMEISDFTLLK